MAHMTPELSSLRLLYPALFDVALAEVEGILDKEKYLPTHIRDLCRAVMVLSWLRGASYQAHG